MSKLSFRARQLDAYKAMPIYRLEEIPDVTDCAAINRAVPQMPTGMEKDEETEHHLQRALSAQQVYGTAEALVIPIPEINDVRKHYEQLYSYEYKLPKQYIHAQSYGLEQEIPDYDMDSEDEAWLNDQSKRLEITAIKFEEMLDRLEKGSGQQVVTLQEAKCLLKEDDDLIIAVYDYWLNKRLKHTPHPLIPTIKTEKRDGSTTNNPYVAFRRRTEKMQTRKNRKNDEVSYEKMLKLRRDLQRAVTLLEMIKKREKCKKELLQLTLEVLEKRYEIEDFSGVHLAHAEAQKTTRSVFYPVYEPNNKDGTETSRKQKRKYEKRKHKSGSSQLQGTDVDVMDYGSTEDEPFSPPMSVSDLEEDSPDGIYTFRRRKNCSYHSPLETCGNWPWNSQSSGGFSDKKYRYSLTTIDVAPETTRCIGYARRRRGRAGRIIFDRGYPEQRADFWDRVCDSSIRTKNELQPDKSNKMESSAIDNTSDLTFREYTEKHKWLHFVSYEDYDSPNALFNGALMDLSSNELNDNLLEPLIDVLPPYESQLSNSLGFTPIVPASSASLVEEIVTPTPAKKGTVSSTMNSSSLIEALTSNNSNTSALGNDQSYDSHQKTLLAWKKEMRDQSAKRIVGGTANLAKSSSASSLVQCSHASLVDPKKAVFAVSALLNGSTNGNRGNGINHIHGPSSKIDIKNVDLHSSTNNTSVTKIRKLNYPLTPSSDTGETAQSAVISDLFALNSLPGDSGDTLTSHSLLSSDKDYIDSAGLNSIPDVGSTMEVT